MSTLKPAVMLAVVEVSAFHQLLMQDVGVEIKIQRSNRLTEGEADGLLFILRVGVIVFVINVVSVAVKMAIGEAIGCQ